MWITWKKEKKKTYKHQKIENQILRYTIQINDIKWGGMLKILLNIFLFK